MKEKKNFTLIVFIVLQRISAIFSVSWVASLLIKESKRWGGTLMWPTDPSNESRGQGKEKLEWLNFKITQLLNWLTDTQ